MDKSESRNNWENISYEYYCGEDDQTKGFEFMNHKNLSHEEKFKQLEKNLQYFISIGNFPMQCYTVLYLLDYVKHVKDSCIDWMNKHERLVDEYLRRMNNPEKYSFSVCDRNMKEYYHGFFLKEKAIVIKTIGKKGFVKESLSYSLRALKKYRFVASQSQNVENDISPNFQGEYGLLCQDIADSYYRLGDRESQIKYCELSLTELRKTKKNNRGGEMKVLKILDAAYSNVGGRKSERLRSLLISLKRVRDIETKFISFRVGDEISIIDRIAVALFDFGFIKKCLHVNKHHYQQFKKVRLQNIELEKKNGCSREKMEDHRLDHIKKKLSVLIILSRLCWYQGRFEEMREYLSEGLPISNELKSVKYLQMIEKSKIPETYRIKEKNGILGRLEKYKICEVCGLKKKKKKRLQVCSICNLYYYCSKLCQKKDWKDHKLYCVDLEKTLI